MPEMVSLADDPDARVRRQVAWSMRLIFATLVGPEKLLDAFLSLSEDDSHRVRRACAETFANISEVVSPEVRVGVLLKVTAAHAAPPAECTMGEQWQQSAMVSKGRTGF